jgi:uncharacterized protein YgiM (DUF1202 family)
MASRIRINIGTGALGAAIIAAAMMTGAPAARAAMAEKDVPATSIVPSGSAPAAAPAEAGAAAAPSPAAKPKPRTTASHATSAKDGEVEPANARLKLVKDDWVFTEPSKWSKHVERVRAGKFVIVTGSTRYYLQVKLKSGKTAYLNPDAVQLVSATDKVFALTHDAAVLDKPNRWGKKLAEVHRGHNVHVVGVALNYVKVRMKNGVEGFIPMSAMQ